MSYNEITKIEEIKRGLKYRYGYLYKDKLYSCWVRNEIKLSVWNEAEYYGDDDKSDIDLEKLEGRAHSVVSDFTENPFFGVFDSKDLAKNKGVSNLVFDIDELIPVVYSVKIKPPFFKALYEIDTMITGARFIKVGSIWKIIKYKNEYPLEIIKKKL